uniref:Putative secreted protein n=1 Tax=Anopheles darlingi TaxID=43151 RepID=A0A2M4DCR1_ANODA
MSSAATLIAGRSKTLPRAVVILTFLTTPSCEGIASTILPMGQHPLGSDASTMTARSPSFSGLTGWCHLERRVSVGR